MILNQDSLHLFISLRSALTQREDNPYDSQENSEKSVSSSTIFKPEEIRLSTDSTREELVRLYFMNQIPNQFNDLNLIFKDSFSGLMYLEIVFTNRNEKEAFYNTHRMIRGISRLSINEALKRLESLNLPKGKSKLLDSCNI